MTTAESKEEISDTDSGIIMHSGLDSPTSPGKDVTTHTRTLNLKQQSLENRLELCLLELRKLYIREAELTGKLPADYPLMPDEKPPRVIRRIGATFKLDEGLIYQGGEDPELSSLEADLALQRQILLAARNLCLEEKLSKTQRKGRLQQCRREEKKAMALQEAVLQHRARSQGNLPQGAMTTNSHKDLCMSDDSSLSDVVVLDDDVDSSGSLSALESSSPVSSLQSNQHCPSLASVEHELIPIQNSPWKESSLDKPYQKPVKPPSACSSRSSSPVRSPVCTESRILPSQFIKSLAMHHTHSNSSPSTPELHVRRQYSQSFRLPKKKPVETLGLSRPPQRCCLADFLVRPPEYSPWRLYQSGSEDSSSEHSASSSSSSSASSTGSPGRQDGPTEVPRLCPPPYGFHLKAHNNKGASIATGPQASPGSAPCSASGPAPGYSQARTENGPLSLQDPAMMKLYLSPAAPVVAPPIQQGQRREGVPPAVPRRAMKPPPPYTRLVRTPSLKEYPDHASRAIPREMVSEELKSWHQRNQLQRAQPVCVERQGSYRVKSPTPLQPPPYKQASGNIILQRAADGTPVQWFVEEDAEIVSQV